MCVGREARSTWVWQMAENGGILQPSNRAVVRKGAPPPAAWRGWLKAMHLRRGKRVSKIWIARENEVLEAGQQRKQTGKGRETARQSERAEAARMHDQPACCPSARAQMGRRTGGGRGWKLLWRSRAQATGGVKADEAARRPPAGCRSCLASTCSRRHELRLLRVKSLAFSTHLLLS